ncbi:hypothetical protein VTH06DRAFT_2439 [Thermothelomyces fergusii]
MAVSPLTWINRLAVHYRSHVWTIQDFDKSKTRQGQPPSRIPIDLAPSFLFLIALGRTNHERLMMLHRLLPTTPTSTNQTSRCLLPFPFPRQR